MIWECPMCGSRVRGPRDLRDADRRCRVCAPRVGGFVLRKRMRGDRPSSPDPRLQHLWCGMDLHAELHRLVQFCPLPVQQRPPSLLIQHVRRQRHLLGEADYPMRRILLLVSPSQHLAFVLATLVHELAHFCAPRDHCHGQDFRAAMIALTSDAYDVYPDPPSRPTIDNLDGMVELALLNWVDEHIEKVRTDLAEVELFHGAVP